MDIGSRLKELRIKHGMTLQKLADKIESSTGFLSDIENNKKSLSFEKLEQICSVYNMTMSDFFSSTEHEKKELYLALETAINKLKNSGLDQNKLDFSVLVFKRLLDEGLINSDGTIQDNAKNALADAMKLDDFFKKG
jgi:transcriptional regulator with XRE-family HTH domain